MNHPSFVSARQGNVLLLMLGLITVMVVVAYAFLRNTQMSLGISQSQRQQKLANLAAEMGLQHAIAVSLHEYAMVSEVRDATVMPAVSRIDSPNKNVFNLLSPRLSTQIKQQQPPTPWDLAPDVSFQDLFSLFSGTYHISPNYNATSSPTMIRGYSGGWTMNRGYARLFEANRFDYNRSVRYDPSTYNDYDLTPTLADPPGMPNAAVVATPFPPVDPFVRGQAIIQRHALDNPLWLDADFRPVSMDDAANAVTNVGAALARYRLRYAINNQDMSPTLWVNTDPAWLTTPDDKATMRAAYKEALYSVAAQFGWTIAHTNGYFTEYGTSLESVFLGYGQYANSRFDGVSGRPLDWPSRGGAPMYYRSPDDGNMTRAIACVHGSPFMTWFDGPSWKGAPLTSWNDLGFAIQNHHESWHDRGENGSQSFTNGYTMVRGDNVAQRATTPFGRPYEAATDHPWQVNILSVPMRVLESMVAAYVPPIVRGTQASEEQIPWVSFPGATPAELAIKSDLATGFWATTAGTVGSLSWNGPSAWIAADPIPGPGVDLFTDAFRPGGTAPFAYPTPANRDYWSSPATARPDHNNPDDTRTNAQRYPGERFFTVEAREGFSQQSTRWVSVASDPPQVGDDPNQDLQIAAIVDSVGTITGTDSLGRHIVFYDPASNPAANPTIPAPAAGNNRGYLSSFFSTSNNRVERWATAFSPISPFACDMYETHGLTNYSADPGEGTQNFFLYSRGNVAWNSAGNYTPADPVPVPDPLNSAYPAASIFTGPGDVKTTAATNRDTLTTSPAPNPLATPGIARSGAVRNLAESYRTIQYEGLNALTATNSYWNRVAVAFTHAVVVTQIANLAYADPTDARNKDFWPDNGYVNPSSGGRNQNNDAAGIIYNPSPNSTNTVTPGMRKGPTTSWNPAAPHFSSMEQVDRQFLANLGESFDTPGTLRTSQVRSAIDPTTGDIRPPRYTKCTSRSFTSTDQNDQSSPATASSYGYGSYLWVGEYHVTNNIRTLLTPCDGVALTPRSTDPQPPPPRLIWLLDEWKADPGATDPDSIAYTPGSAVGPNPTPVARTRAKLMERVLNDWRMSFLGSTKAYADTFRPKDFDSDGLVFCSGYLGGSTVDTDTGLTCWQEVDPATFGDGPGNGVTPGDPGSIEARRLTIFSVTGCLAFTRSHHYKIQVRGELFDNVLGRPIAEKYLEAALLVDPDNNIVRSSNPAVLPTGLGDSTVIMQRPIHNYYRGYLSNTYP